MPDSNAAITRDPGAARGGPAAVNALSADQARRAFLQCCGSERWARGMAACRPYTSTAAVVRRAGELFDELDHDDWRQAFATHAAIGAPQPGDAQGSGEQAALAAAGDELLDALRDGNERYRDRFGHVFLIRARGRGAGELLAALRDRLDNPPEQELRNAAAAQREITALRLAELLDGR
jgi:2-oxo-4-hydroxy-4-carboxy-5-ureidoimidazoline decarboxylase